MKEPSNRSASRQLSVQAQFFHDAVARWLDRRGVTIACGRWADGAISEILPQGQAMLLPSLYDGCFTGVRELRLAGQPHHLHIDFGRVHRLGYAVAPSVCLAFKPSFELRLLTLGAGGAPTDRWAVSLMLESPYAGGELDLAAATQFFRHAADDAARRPDLVELTIDPAVRESVVGLKVLTALRQAFNLPDDADWDTAMRAVAPARPPVQDEVEPPFLPLLREALALRDASLVIFRDRTLIEFKTERLDGLHRYEEAGHVSWQVGDQHDHHCHLSLGGVTRVLFSAEPVSCQGGGLNYTVWFLTAAPCGNPHRRDGYFSIVLNRPYTGDEPRREVIEPVLSLYRRHRDRPFVEADATFLRVLEQGPPGRRDRAELDHAPA
jgi:hypothetical protein